MSSVPISAAYLERKLRAITGVAGASPIPDLDTLRGLLVIENDRPEWANPAGENLCAGTVQFAAVAAQVVTARIRNPVDSGVIGIVERVCFSVGGATEVRGFQSYNLAATGDLATAFGLKVNRDPRGRDNSNFNVTSLQLSGLRAAASGAVGVQFFHAPLGGSLLTEMVNKDSPIILPPGSALDVDELIVNLNTAVNFFWRERPLEGDFELK